MSNEWLKNINVYCERTDASFWAEPLNAISNLVFILAAWMAYRAYKQTNDTYTQKTSLLLIVMVCVIGLGSFLFHTFANRLTGMMDIIPIGLTIFLFYILTLSNIFHMKWWTVIVAVAYFPFGVWLVGFPLFDGLGSSAMYLPALFILIGLSVAAIVKEVHSAHYLVMAFLTFTISLLFRAADGFVCDQFIYGTHFMWHILNATTLYLCLRFYMQGRLKDADHV